MNKIIRITALALLGLPLAALAYGRVGVGVHVGGGYYGGPHYYGHGGWYGPRYGGWYGPRYGYWYGAGYYPYYYYGPGYGYYYYPPPAQVYEEPEETVVEQPAPAYWYYCQSARNYYPYVQGCPEGWQAVPAQSAPAPQNQPPQAGGQPAPPPAPSGRVTYRLGDLLFGSDKAELQPGATATLDSMIATISKEPNRRIVVEGHTDSVGDAAHNRELSQRRADAVRQYLIAHGVAPERITALGKGEADPIAPNDTADGRRHNRRVDVVVS
jgi:outer membrane protein OmpA-like peptidoglycan-associated protein